MNRYQRSFLPVGLLLPALLTGCGEVGDALFGESSTSASTSTGAGTGGSTSTAGGGGSDTTGSGGSGGSGGEAPAVIDPNSDGPYTIKEIDDSIKVPATGDTVPIHCAYPIAGPTDGAYPVVVVAHGFQLPASQYYGYIRRLASFGYIALTADFPAGFVGVNNVKNAKDLLGAIDWVGTSPGLASKADMNQIGVTGHSLGGKLSLLAATLDARIKASIVLDPVDSSFGCNPQDCPDVSSLMPGLKIPTAFLGETTDAAGGFQPCAPADSNYTTFFAAANAPSLQVTVNGANHMSFLDDVATCGPTCNFCKPASAPNAEVVALARSYVVAFYERWLRGDAGYDAFLTGAEAQARYVTTGKATIEAK